MSLVAYRKKRSFGKTPEPQGMPTRQGKNKTAIDGPLRFVIQRHEASRLHYDFRLELDGVLKSWAIPKGPSLNPDDKRLAVMVEDHPMEYANFEGIIPKDNYGAGTVMVWDRGVYSPIAFVDRKQAQVLLKEQLEKGHLTFIMLGEKLQGEFALVKTKGREENAWLLFKAGDEYASTKDILAKDKSVLTGRSMEEIEKQAEKNQEVWYAKPDAPKVDILPKGKMPHNVKPMLAKIIEEPFDDKNFLFEIKYDGYRAIAEIEKKQVSLYSRNKLSFNEKFAPIVTSLQKFPADAVLDGEVVVVDNHGKPQFHLLQDYHKQKQGHLIYYVFDMLYYDGHDLTSLPLLRRKELLKEMLPPLHGIVYSDHIEEHGIGMFQQAQKHGIEGIMAKNKLSTYNQGQRSDVWLKIKISHRQEVVIAGFTKPKGSRQHFGALIAGIYKKGRLVYVGHVGGGFDTTQLGSIYKELVPLKQDSCPFEEEPETNAPVTWIKPNVIAQVAFSEWTKDGMMRHPIFLGLRNDKDADEVEAEIAVIPAKAGIQVPKTLDSHFHGNDKVNFSNLTKVFYPQEGYTKGDLIEYYKEIAPIILPYLKDRPESLLRYPNGIAGKSFYQKDADLLDAKWIKKTRIHSDSNEKDVSYLLCQDEETLLYMINLGCIDLNPWNSRVGKVEYPDYLLIDLDPHGASFGDVIKTALAVRDVMEQLDIPSFPKTSGATGMHIYIPLGAMYTYEQCRHLAELLCLHVHNKIPRITSMKRSPHERKGLVYLDYLQNIKGQTLASVYSVRAQPGATVSTPLKWSEVNKKLHPTQFTIKNTPARIAKKGDLFKGVLGKGIKMEKVLDKISNSLH